MKCHPFGCSDTIDVKSYRTANHLNSRHGLKHAIFRMPADTAFWTGVQEERLSTTKEILQSGGGESWRISGQFSEEMAHNITIVVVVWKLNHFKVSRYDR